MHDDVLAARNCVGRATRLSVSKRQAVLATSTNHSASLLDSAQNRGRVPAIHWRLLQISESLDGTVDKRRQRYQGTQLAGRTTCPSFPVEQWMRGLGLVTDW